MMNRKIPLRHHGYLNKLLSMAIIALAFLFLFEIDLPTSCAEENTADPSIVNAKPAAKTRDDDDHKKKKKKRKKSDDDDEDDYGTQVKGAHPTPPFTMPAVVPGMHYTYFMAIGDWGAGSPAQRRVAELMNAKAAGGFLHFVLLLGDNFYEKGVSSVDDPQWQEKFETVYNLPNLNVPFWAALGNHDHKNAASPDAEVNYSKRNTKWKMPARFFTFTRTLDSRASVQFFALDTEALNMDDLKGGDQVDWLETELAKSQATWKVVFGHHPVFSNGKHGDTPAMQELIRPLLEKYHVDFYICGHDHDRQLLQPVADVHYIVCGTGAKSRDTVWANNTIFAASDLGFTWYRVAAEEFHVQFINKAGDIEFAYTVNKANKRADGKAADKE